MSPSKIEFGFTAHKISDKEIDAITRNSIHILTHMYHKPYAMDWGDAIYKAEKEVRFKNVNTVYDG